MSGRPEDGRAVRRVIRVLRGLKGRSLPGRSLSDLAREVEESPPTLLRTLQTLAAEGAVTQYETGMWGLSVELLAIATAHEQEINRGVTRIQEFASRVRAAAAV